MTFSRTNITAFKFTVVLFSIGTALAGKTQSFAPGVGRLGVSSSVAAKIKATNQPSAQRTLKAIIALAATTVSSGTPVEKKVSDAKAVLEAVTVTSAGDKDISVVGLVSPLLAVPGQAADTYPIELSNSKTGTTQYQVAATPITGDNAADFSVASCTDAPLIPGGECDLVVTYKPAKVGASKAVLTITLHPLIPAGGADISVAVDLVGLGGNACVLPTRPFGPLIGVNAGFVNCYFNTNKNYSFGNQVGYLYNPAGSANVVNADLASLRFLGGVQVSLSGNATNSSCTNTTTNTGIACGGTMPGDTTTQTVPSLQQDIQTLTQGGDFALRAEWPWFDFRRGPVQLISMVVPRVGFSVSGLGGQNTATGATELNSYIANETYLQIDAISLDGGTDKTGAVYFDYRFGSEHVSTDFATSAGLPNNNFFLQQISAGIALGDAIRVSAQHYYGPMQSYVANGNTPVSVNNFSNWQLSIQVSPTNLKGSSPK